MDFMWPWVTSGGVIVLLFLIWRWEKAGVWTSLAKLIDRIKEVKGPGFVITTEREEVKKFGEVVEAEIGESEGVKEFPSPEMGTEPKPLEPGQTP